MEKGDIGIFLIFCLISGLGVYTLRQPRIECNDFYIGDNGIVLDPYITNMFGERYNNNITVYYELHMIKENVTISDTLNNTQWDEDIGLCWVLQDAYILDVVIYSDKHYIVPYTNRYYVGDVEEALYERKLIEECVDLWEKA